MQARQRIIKFHKKKFRAGNPTLCAITSYTTIPSILAFALWKCWCIKGKILFCILQCLYREFYMALVINAMTIVKLKSFNIMLKMTLPKYARGFWNVSGQVPYFPSYLIVKSKISKWTLRHGLTFFIVIFIFLTLYPILSVSLLMGRIGNCCFIIS